MTVSGGSASRTSITDSFVRVDSCFSLSLLSLSFVNMKGRPHLIHPRLHGNQSAAAQRSSLCLCGRADCPCRLHRRSYPTTRAMQHLHVVVRRGWIFHAFRCQNRWGSICGNLPWRNGHISMRCQHHLLDK